MAPYTSAEEIVRSHQILEETFKSGKTKSIAWRKWQLKQVWWMIDENKDAIAEALKKDLNRHRFESFFVDIGASLRDVITHLDHIEEWSADQIPNAGLFFGTLCQARIRQEPLGVTMVMSAFNFPVLLLIMPLVAAISAGCCVLLKPSEVSENVQNIFAELVPKYLDPSAIRIATGGIPETTRLLELKWDMIFYTGSPMVGRIISEAAAKHLTRTVLELGGQDPAIVTRSADLDLAAKRIALSKYNNAGQICLSSNHVFVDPSVADEFAKKLSHYFNQYLSKSGRDDIVHIINDRHFDRLSGLLSKTSGTIVSGGSTDKQTRFIEPTVVTNVDLSDSLMSQELFGPLLPVLQIPYKEACQIVSRGEHPLAVYIFSSDPNEIDYILSHTQSGGVTINDCMLHTGVPDAPFGGVGNSGLGAYHGRYGFDAFTHKRTVAQIPGWLDTLMAFRYPPFKEANISKVSIKNPGFKRGEQLEDQKVTGRVEAAVKGLVRQGTRVFVLAVVLAMLDARLLGGQPALLRGIGQFWWRVKGLLPWGVGGRR